MGGVAAFTAPILVSALGLRPVLVLVGAVLPVLSLTLLGRFRKIDDHAEPAPELLSLFSNISLFAPLPPTTLEKISARCSVVEVPPGNVIINEGDHGDRFYAILEGQVEVHRGEAVQCRFGPGDHFGEIALLRDINRTATVVSVSDVRLATLGMTEFLDALASSEAAYGIAWRSTTEMIETNAATAQFPQV